MRLYQGDVENQTKTKRLTTEEKRKRKKEEKKATPFLPPVYSTVQFSSVQDGNYALEKAHIRSAPSLRSVPNVAFETVSMFV